MFLIDNVTKWWLYCPLNKYGTKELKRRVSAFGSLQIVASSGIGKVCNRSELSFVGQMRVSSISC